MLAERADGSSHGAAQLILGTPFPLEGLILSQPAAATGVFGAEEELTTQLAQSGDSLLSPPWRIIYRLIKAEPALAADILAEFHVQGETKLVSESLAHLAYDKDRSERSTELSISLEAGGLFLERLYRSEGADWLHDRLAESVEL